MEVPAFAGMTVQYIKLGLGIDLHYQRINLVIR